MLEQMQHQIGFRRQQCRGKNLAKIRRDNFSKMRPKNMPG
jgi:hypothetical protein